MECETHYDLGIRAYDGGHYSEAAFHLEKVWAASPTDPMVLTRLGSAFKQSGQFERAAEVHLQIAQSYPSVPEVWSNLGATYLAWGRFDDALGYFEKAVRLAPQSSELHFNLGTARQKSGDLEGAISSLCNALSLQPGHVRAWMNLGICQKALGRYENALDAQREAVTLSPENPDAQWNLALTELLLGDLKSGYRRYEYRRRIPGYPKPGGRDWKGEPVSGTLNVYAEQGFGDTLQFVRYLSGLKNRASRIVLWVRPQMRPLLHDGLLDVDEIRPLERIPDSEWSVPLMSLPHLLDDHEKQIVDAPYLHPDTELVEKWTKVLAKEPDMKVGICWQGNPGHRDDKNRSVALREWLPLLRTKGVRFYSLQKHNGLEQLQELPDDVSVENLSDSLDTNTGPFMDTAALARALDLVLTVDTSIAHLAGAVGANCWTLIPFAADFRWGLSDRALYGAMRLFRQPSRGDWSTAMKAAHESLQEELKSRGHVHD